MQHRYALKFIPTNIQDPSKHLSINTSFNDLNYNVKMEIIKKPETLNVQQKAPPSLFKIIIIGLIGNMMEWYDFAVYGYFATIIARLFFPMTDPAVSLIASFGAFAAGFLMRPLGGLVFGRIGDLVGRQKAMTLSVIAMAAPTILMAFLPT